MIHYYDPKDFYVTDQLISSYPKIRKEYMRWHKFTKRVRYKNWLWENIDLEKQGCWEIIPLMRHHEPIRHLRFFFPTTFDLIYRLPIYENLMFSIFSPGTEVHPHIGWSSHFVRIHLGIDCNDECELVLEQQTLKEENGKVIMFDDFQRHYAYNRGTTSRVVLIFDMLISDLEKYRKQSLTSS